MTLTFLSFEASYEPKRVFVIVKIYKSVGKLRRQSESVPNRLKKSHDEAQMLP